MYKFCLVLVETPMNSSYTSPSYDWNLCCFKINILLYRILYFSLLLSRPYKFNAFNLCQWWFKEQRIHSKIISVKSPILPLDDVLKVTIVVSNSPGVGLLGTSKAGVSIRLALLALDLNVLYIQALTLFTFWHKYHLDVLLACHVWAKWYTQIFHWLFCFYFYICVGDSWLCH